MKKQAIDCGVFARCALALACVAGCGKEMTPQAIREVKLPDIPFLKQQTPPFVRPLRSVQLMPGEQTTVSVVVDRNDNEGPVTAVVKDLPPGITAAIEPAVDVDGTATIAIKIAADSTLGDVPLDELCSLDIAVKDTPLPRKLKVQVPKVARPEVPVQPPFLIQPGTDAIWRVPIDRRGCEGPIEFQATPSSDMISVELANVSADESEARVKIAVAADAPEGEASCGLEWKSYGRVMNASLPVRIVRQPFVLPAVVAIALLPGEQRHVTLGIERAGHDGPVSLAVDPLPEGVSATPEVLTIEAESGTVIFRADESAPEGVAMVPVRASAGHLSARGLVSVRVLGRTPRKSLPEDVVAALPERVKRGRVAARSVPTARAGLAGLYGSTEESGPAVERALRWLASRQADSGEWPPMAEAGVAGAEAGVAGAEAGVAGAAAATALALLPFLAEGLTHDPASALTPEMEPYPAVVNKGLTFLGTGQPLDGDQAGAIGSSMTAHLLGLVAFSEAYALVDNDDKKSREDVEARDAWKDRAKLAVDRLIKFQGKKNGEWAVHEGATARDTALAAVVLQSARSHGIGVPASALRKAVKHLETYGTSDPPPGSLFSPSPKRPADAELSAVCLLAMLGEGREHDAPEIVAGCDFLAGFAPAVDAARAERSPLFFVTAGEVLRTVEGERYDAWNAALRSFLTARQEQEGEQAGSWDPAIFGGSGDRVWATACATLCLQSHFRLLSLSRPLP